MRAGKLNNKGMTLVEMIVSFALLGLFMVAAARVISYTVNIYFAAKGMDNSVVVSNMIADKVDSLVSSMSEDAEIDLKTLGVAGGDESDKLPIVKDGILYFVDGTNCPIGVTCADGELSITYFNRQEDAEGNVTYEQVPWSFDKKAYMGYEIEAGSFSLDKAGADYPGNVYRLEFTVTSERYGDYDTTRYIKCYGVSG